MGKFDKKRKEEREEMKKGPAACLVLPPPKRLAVFSCWRTVYISGKKIFVFFGTNA